jgi:hypothetical protein
LHKSFWLAFIKTTSFLVSQISQRKADTPVNKYGFAFCPPIVTIDGAYPQCSIVVQFQKQNVLHAIEIWRKNTQRQGDG